MFSAPVLAAAFALRYRPMIESSLNISSGDTVIDSCDSFLVAGFGKNGKFGSLACLCFLGRFTGLGCYQTCFFYWSLLCSEALGVAYELGVCISSLLYV